MKINWGLVPDAENFEPVPIGRYPAILKVDNLKRDQQGNAMTDAEGKPAIRTTNAGDEMWHLEAHILEGKQIGRYIYDQISFGEKALKRAKVILSRAGIIEGDETYDCQPDELDGTYWWIEVDRHEARMNRDGTPKLTKAGKPIVDPRIAFAGFEAMSPPDAKKYGESYRAWLAKKADESVPENGAAGEKGADEVPF